MANVNGNAPGNVPNHNSGNAPKGARPLQNPKTGGSPSGGVTPQNPQTASKDSSGSFNTLKDKLPTKKLSHGSNPDEKEQIKQNADKIRNLSDKASKAPHPVVNKAGDALKGLDKLTHGKSSELLAKPLTKLENKIPPPLRKNKNDDAGLKNILNKNRNMNHAPMNNNKEGGEQKNGSLPSSDEKKEDEKKSKLKKIEDSVNQITQLKQKEEEQKQQRSIAVKLVRAAIIRTIIMTLLPFIVVIFIIFITTAYASSLFSDLDDAFGISMEMEEDTGRVDYKANEQDEKFYKRVREVKEEYQARGKNFDTLEVVAVYHTVIKYGADLTSKKMKKDKIREIADLMFENNSYNKEKFKENLINIYFPKYTPDTTQGQREEMAEEVFNYIQRYYDFIHKKKKKSSNCASIGSCSYDIKGYYISDKGNVVENINVTDLYVQLMQCGNGYGGTFGVPVEGEELVPFEKYILGVAYAENEGGPPEAMKAQMIAARSYALARHADMRGWRTLTQTDGKWILRVAACTQDQVYCDPDQGCSSTDGQNAMVLSGSGHGTGYVKGPLPADHPYRQYAAETQGQVLVNSAGNIIYSGYTQTTQNDFNSMANSGLDYKQILLQKYPNASDIYQASCNDGTSSSGCTGSTGDFASWKQYEGDWADTVTVGTSGKTIHDIGCLATSVAIQVAKSGVPVNVDTLNPGTFVSYLNEHGGFSGGDFVWGSVSNIAPTFHFVNKVGLSGMTKEQKLAKITELTNQPNTYVVAEVKGNTGQHWVAIDAVNGDTVLMMDPGSSSTDMWAEYNWQNTSTLAYFVVS